MMDKHLEYVEKIWNKSGMSEKYSKPGELT